MLLGEIDLRLQVEKGYIENLKIYGDFFFKEPVEKLQDHLQGIRYDWKVLDRRLKSIAIEDFFGGLPKEEFLELVYGADD